jgi:putative transposase
MPFPRKNIRLPAERYVGKRAYFITICCQDRRPALRDAKTVTRHLEIVDALAKQLAFAVHAYCFMPDHVHFLCEGLAPESDVLDFVNRFKQQTAFEYPSRGGAILWQFKFYDHILRRSDSMDNVAWYIWMNPVRKGLCAAPLDFPYSGSLTIPARERQCPAKNWVPPWKTGAEDAGLKPGATYA